MPPTPPAILILRLDKESPKKCSLTPLRQRGDERFRWFDCSVGQEVEVGEATLLHPEGELLGPADAVRPLLLVDSSWSDLPRVLRGVKGALTRRRLPEGLRSAYPRKSNWFPDPVAGLASIEALHAALALLGAREDALLDGYRWKEEWLRENAAQLGEG